MTDVSSLVCDAGGLPHCFHFLTRCSSTRSLKARGAAGHMVLPGHMVLRGTRDRVRIRHAPASKERLGVAFVSRVIVVVVNYSTRFFGL